MYLPYAKGVIHTSPRATPSCANSTLDLWMYLPYAKGVISYQPTGNAILC
jgi:hypothetical protein